MKYVIRKDTLISDITKKSPRALKLLTDYGLSCADCFLNQFETLENGAKLHGMTDGEIAKMIKEINAELKKEEK